MTIYSQALSHALHFSNKGIGQKGKEKITRIIDKRTERMQAQKMKNNKKKKTRKVKANFSMIVSDQFKHTSTNFQNILD